MGAKLRLSTMLLFLALSVATVRLWAQASDASEAAQKAAETSGGRVVDVQTATHDGAITYVVKVLTDDGRVKVINVPGADVSP